MIYYYSGTGNSRFIATQLAALTADAARSIADIMAGKGDATMQKCDAEAFASDANTAKADLPAPAAGENAALLGFVFPVYGWQPPKIVRRFCEMLTTAVASGRFVYVVMTCGDDAGKTFNMFRRLVARRGIGIDSAYSVLMPDVYVCLPGFDVDKDEERRAKFTNAAARITDIAARINRREPAFDIFEGIMPRTKSYVLGPLFYKWFVKDKPFRSGSACNGCGICSKGCPVGNISLRDGHPAWNGNCEGCLNCYHSCPRRAIDFGGRTKGKGQYTFKRHEAEMNEILHRQPERRDE